MTNVTGPGAARGKLSAAKAVLLEKRLRGEMAAPSARETIARRPPGPPPISFAQLRLWFLDQLEPASPSYNIPAGFWLEGLLDVTALERSLNEILCRHEVLRASFPAVDGKPIQIIAAERHLTLVAENLANLPEAERQAAAQTLAREEAIRPFDLAYGPLIRVRLLRLAEPQTRSVTGFDYLMVVTLHHIVADAWSIEILIRELAALYPAFAAGHLHQLDELPIHYSDYAHWQRTALQGGFLDSQLAYWRKRLAGHDGVLKLPSDRPRPALGSHRGEAFSWRLNNSVVNRLDELCQREGVTSFMTLLAAFNILLCRYTGQTDLCIGSPVANRNRIETEGLVGFLANTLVLRTDVSGDPTFVELLRRVREVTLGALAHQDLPFERLVEELSPERDLAPLVQVMFVLQNAPLQTMELGNLVVAPLALDTMTAKFDLTLSVAKDREGLTASIEYSVALFDLATIEQLARHYGAILDGIVADPGTRVSELPLLSDAERRQILIEWNATSADYPQDRLLHELFEEQVARAPEAVAAVLEDVHLTYAELNARANQLAHHLRGRGIGPEVVVGLCVERSLEMLIGILGILKAGGAYLPLDPGYPGERLAYMIEDAGPLLILTQERLRERLPEATLTLCLDKEWPSISHASQSNPAAGAIPQNLAYVIYTSGSTGRPKGVGVSHQNVRRLFAATEAEYCFAATDVWTLFHSYAFDFSVWEIWGALLYGGRLIIVPYWISRSPETFHELLGKHSVTVLNQTPSSFYQLDAVDVAQGATKPLSLRLVIFGGEALELQRLAAWFARHGDDCPQLVNMYGITETTVHVTLQRLKRSNAHASKGSAIGRPLGDLQAYVLDTVGQPVPIGVEGELYIGGFGLARGYLGRPDLTAERFVPDPFGGAGGRLYRTGDLARWRPDGSLDYVGRIDHQVKVRGHRIELGEIEAALSALEAVRQAIVVALEDASGGNRLVAYVVGEAEPEALRTALRERLPDYMIPSAFVRLDVLPLTPNGKIDRKAFPMPDINAHAQRQYIAPRNPTEETLCRIWADVLGLERVGIEDNFFELGGHSLLAVTLIERIRRDGLQADVRALFGAPTPAGLAAAIGNGSEVVVPPNLIPPGCDAITPKMLPLVDLSQADIDRIAGGVPGGASNVQDIYPLAPLQEGILFHHLMAAKGDPYLMPILLALDTRERFEGFLGALQAVIARHDILRTAVAWKGLPEPVQVVWREAPLIVEDVSLDLSEGDVAKQLRARFDPRQLRLDLRQAPLMRGFIARDAARDRWLLLLLVHHLALDHTTLEILVEEAQAHLLGRPGRLPAPLPFRNFVAQARLGVSRSDHEAFFQAMLGDVTEPTAPFGLLDVQGDGSGIGEARLDLDLVLARRVRQQARTLGVSAASLCHQAFAQVLARVSGRADVVFGTVLFGRMHGGEGADRAPGIFINTLPVRVRVGAASVAEGVRRMHELLSELLRHEHASLALAQRCSAVVAPAPLFSALLNYRHSPAHADVSGEAAPAWEGVETLHSEERTNYPLTLSVDDLGEGLQLTAQTQRPLDPNRICAFMGVALERLVEALEAAPDTPARAIDVLPEAERRQILFEWNDPAADYPQDRLLHELFEEQVARAPEAVAAVLDDVHLTYAELNAKANQLAHHLRGRGIGPEVVVGLCVERSLEMLIGILGILKAGGAYLPLDPGYPGERLAYMIEDAGPLLILTQERLRERLPEATLTLCLDKEWPSISHASQSNPAAGAIPQNLAYVIYTSGSTGRPKGVGVSHQNVRRLFAATEAEYCFAATDVWTLFHSYAFDFSVWEIWGALLYGGRLIIVPYWISRSPETFHELLGKHSVTVLNQTPSSFYQLDAVDVAQGATKPLSLRLVIFGGEALELQRLAAWFARHGDDCPQLVNMYGITETTVHVTLQRLKRGNAHASKGSAIGRPLGDLQAYVLDTVGQPVPIGVEGELYIGGFGLARGYLGRPDLTAERFVPDPFGGAGGRLYRTGDLARWRPDGSLDYVGRIDHQVKVRGHRIELGEIEAALSALEAVRQAIVVALEDASGGNRLVAYVVGEAEPEALRTALRERLPDYMIPSAFVRLDVLPLTPNGKIDRKAFPMPDINAHAQRQYIAPRNPTEETLCRIWADVLGLERVGIEDNFFELGGHSLLAVTLIERIRRDGLQADVRALFGAPTPAGLAAAIGNGSEVVVPPNLIPPGCDAITPKMLPLVDLSQADIDRIAGGVPGGASNVQDIYPLAPLQEGILFHHLMAAKGDPYLMPILLALDTRERFEGFLGALQAVIARHDILRTAVVWEGLPEPVQVVWREAPLIVEDVSLDFSEGDVAEQLRARFDPRQLRLDLRQAPLMRGFIARDAARDRWLLLLLVHHLALDHTTLEILVEEAQAHLLGRAGRHPAPLPFRNFVAQARLGVSRSDHEAFFQAMLGDVTEPTAPFGLLDVQGDGSGIEEARLDLDPVLARRVRQQARTLGVSAASLCHQAFAQVLTRVSGRADVVFGTVLFGRMHGGEGVDRAPGIFINTLPVRVRVGAASVAEGVRRMHELLSELLRHEHASLALAQRCSAVVAPAPLFSALLNYRHSPAQADVSGEAAPAWEGVETLHSEERTNYPFSLDVDDLGEDFQLTAQVQRPLDPNRVCAFMRVALERLVDALETAPDTATRAIDVLPEAERRQMLIEWNDTAVDYPQDRLLHELFEEQVARAPEAVAAVFEDVHLTYAELNAKANQLAHYLRERGVGPDAIVGICVERSLEMVIGILGILKAGGAYLPLDPDYPRQRLAYMLADAGPLLVLTQERLRERLPEAIGTLCLDKEWPSISHASQSNPAAGATPQNLAYVIYTSGSTGRPKGVAIAHRGVVNLTLGQANTFKLSTKDRVLQLGSLSFDLATEEIFPALVSGAALVLCSERVRASWPDFVNFAAGAGLTVFNLTTAFWHHLTAWLAEASAAPPECLRLVCVGGEKASTEFSRLWRTLVTNRVAWINSYGPTEATVTATIFEMKDESEGSRDLLPIGRPISNTRIYLLDDHLLPVPVGVAGELYIGGAGLARGYLGRPDLTAERFVPDPFGGAGKRLYRTGDLARYRPDGNIEFLGRIDHQVKIRGFRIELGEIEAALCRIAGVREAVVLAREDQPGEKRLVAYVAGQAGTELAAGDLRTALRERLPDYMIPSAFVRLDVLPLTPNGKIDRKAFPMPDAEPNPQARYTAPRTAVEEILAGIWADVLGRERVGIDENFFEIGGHSLSATQVISRIRRDLGAEIGLRSLFEMPTVSKLACLVPRASSIERSKKDLVPLIPPLTARPRRSPIPLSFEQQRLWFLDKLEPGSPFYNIPLALRLVGDLNVVALEEALRKVVQRHEVLRTCFPLVDGQPVQSLQPDLTINLPLFRFHHVPMHVQAAELHHLILAEAQKPFDLAAGPLIRGCIFEPAPAEVGDAGEHILVLTLHHSIADGWSTGILISELAVLYRSLVSDEISPPADLALQYADYALWQREYLNGEELDRQLSYWRARLSDAPAILRLPTDRPRPRLQSYAGASYSMSLPRDLIEKLGTVTRRNGATLYMALLAAFQLLLSRHSGQDDICVGMPVAKRGRVEIEGLIGCFVNTLVLRTDLSGNPRFNELLARVRAATLEALDHQDLPFERLVMELDLARELGHNPLFQVSFSLDNTPAPQIEADDLVIETIKVETKTAMFDLSVDAVETADGLLFFFEYNSDLFFRSTIERLALHYEALLNSIVAQPDARLSDLSILTESERCWLLDVGHGSDVSTARVPGWPRSEETVVTLMEDQVERFPGRLAVVDGKTELTYREINIWANRLAHRLISLGVGPDVVVGVYAESSIELVVALLAVLKSGGTYVPLDPAYPHERLQAMLEDCTPAILLSQGRVPDDLAGERIVLALQGDDCFGYSEINPMMSVDGQNLAYILFTSGSTGRPKGVAIPHRALANRVLWGAAEFDLGPDDIVLQLTSPSFDVSAWEIFGSLAAGARLVIAGAAAADPDRLSELVVCHSVTIIDLVPSLLRALMLTPCWRDCQTLRQVCCGGEAMSDMLAIKFGASLGCRLYNMYGPTETTIDATYWTCGTARDDCSSGAGVPIGRTIGGVGLYVLDKHMNLAPLEVAGELYIGGIGLARGYFRQPHLTAERFVPDPFSTEGGRLYRTGDLARWRSDGALEFRGRIDHQVKLRGFRIELEEIESRLEEFPGVAEAAVALRTDARGEQCLAAFVAAYDNTITPAALRRHIRAVLPSFMAPSAWLLMPTLPRDSNGKLQRSALLCLLPATTQQPAGLADDAVPATEMEALLACLFADILGLPLVGRHDNFFEFGGHSLLAVQLIQRVRDALHTDIPLVALFQYPTVAALAERLHPDRNDFASPFVRLREGAAGRSPLYLLHTGAGHIRGYQPIVAALDQDEPIYGIQMRAVETAAMETQDFDTAVTDYAVLLRDHHKGGAYRLLGWSLGGLIALGVAARLEQLGAKVDFLGLVDTDLPRRFDQHDWNGRLAEFLQDPGDRSILATLPEREIQELERILADVPHARRPASAALWGRERGLWLNHIPLDILRLETSLWRHVAIIEDTFLTPRLTADLHIWWARGSLGEGNIPPVDWAAQSRSKAHVTIIEGDHKSIISSPDLHASVRDILSGLDA